MRKVFFLMFNLVNILAGKAQDTSYLKQNVAIIDVMIRSISSDYFVKQILVVDFDRSQNLPDGIGFFEEGYTDDGLGFDLFAGDGIYTTVDSFQHSQTAPYYPDTLTRSVTDRAPVDISFAHHSELNRYLATYTPPGTPGKWIISIDCDTYWCACSNPNCDHCIIKWGPLMGCVGCPKFKNCHFEIVWEW